MADVAAAEVAAVETADASALEVADAPAVEAGAAAHDDDAAVSVKRSELSIPSGAYVYTLHQYIIHRRQNAP